MSKVKAKTDDKTNYEEALVKLQKLYTTPVCDREVSDDRLDLKSIMEGRSVDLAGQPNIDEKTN